MPLDDENLWDYMITQYQFIITQFGIGIVGLGALLFAYGTVKSALLKELIALVGLASSYILLMHTFGATREIKALRDELRKSSPDFFKRYEALSTWRSRDIVRYLYYPVTRMITYFMGLLSLAWLSIILFLNGVPLESLIYINVFAIVFTFGFAIFRRYQDFKQF
jgi:4-hydroxybenzoate polyprenyltransferase